MFIDRDPDALFKTRRRLLTFGLAGIVASLPGLSSRAETRPARRLDVPYEPSPQHVVEKMLELAKVNENDLLYDLGCGDGRIVITAAQKYGAHGVGIDLDPQRIAEAKANAEKGGVQDKVKFIVGDLYATDFSDATVVTLFLWPDVNRKLRPILWQRLKTGTRVVSHLWDMGPEWPPEKTESIENRKIYYWTVTEEQKKRAAT